MRTFADSPVWSILKRLTLGLGLIALFSSILLVSDLGHRRTASAANAGAGGRKFKAAIVYFARECGTDQCVQGLIDGLKASGFEEGKNLEVRRADAQGEMINIPAMLQNYDSSDVDLIMTITTPCLAGACNKVKHKTVVFTCVTRSDCRGSGQDSHRPLAFRDRRRQFPAGKPHAGYDAEAGSGIARSRNHVQPGGSQFGEGDSRSPAKYFGNAASGSRRSPSPDPMKSCRQCRSLLDATSRWCGCRETTPPSKDMKAR